MVGSTVGTVWKLGWRGLLAGVALVLAAGVTVAPGAHAADRADIRKMPVTITGQVLSWNGMAGSYQVVSTFQRRGQVIVKQGATGSDVEVAVLSGSVIDFEDGTVTFVSNSAMLEHVSGVAWFPSMAEVPAAQVRQNSSGTITATVLPSYARTVQLNRFGRSQIVGGTVTIDRSGSSVRGTIKLHGSGYIEPGNGAFPTVVYQASFSSS